MGPAGGQKDKKKSGKHDKIYPELLVPGEKVQVDAKELNEKLRKHLHWINRKIMRTPGNKSPIELLRKNWPHSKLNA